MSYLLCKLLKKPVLNRIIKGSIIEAIKVDTRSSDYGSCELHERLKSQADAGGGVCGDLTPWR